MIKQEQTKPNVKQKKPHLKGSHRDSGFLGSSGGKIRASELRVMSPKKV